MIRVERLKSDRYARFVFRPAWRVFLFWASIAFGLPCMAFAQPVTITAGEHATFTRIVLQSSRSFQWDMQENGTTVTLHVPGRQLTLDRTRALSRISTTRVSTLSVDSGSMIVTRNCPCPVQIFEDRPGVVVLDFLNASEEGLPPPLANSGSDLSGRTPALTDATTAGRTVARSFMDAETSLSADQDEIRRLAADAVMPTQTLTELAEALSRAMMRRGGIPDMPAADPPGSLTVPSRIPAGLPANVRLRSASDRIALERDQGSMPDECPSDDMLRFASSPQEVGFVAETATLHRRLVGEFDRIDQAAALALVEHYLGWGLGAEARMVLNMLDPVLAQFELLSGIADVLDDRQSNSRRSLSSLRNCGGVAEIFAAVAGRERRYDDADGFNTHLAVTHFQQLTPALRGLIGPDIATLLLSHGEVDLARVVLDSFRPIVGPDAAEVIRIEADLERARGEIQRSDTRLAQLDPGDITNLLLRLEVAWARDQVMETGILETAIGVAAMHRTENVGRRVLELVILHKLRAGAVRDALSELDRLSRWTGHAIGASPVLDQLLITAWQASLGLADTDFLDLVLTRADWQHAASDRDFAQSLAGRFEALGLTRLAEDLRNSRQRQDRDDQTAPRSDPAPIASRTAQSPSDDPPQIEALPSPDNVTRSAALAAGGRQLEALQPAGWPMSVASGTAPDAGIEAGLSNLTALSRPVTDSLIPPEHESMTHGILGRSDSLPPLAGQAALPFRPASDPAVRSDALQTVPSTELAQGNSTAVPIPPNTGLPPPTPAPPPTQAQIQATASPPDEQAGLPMTDNDRAAADDTETTSAQSEDPGRQDAMSRSLQTLAETERLRQSLSGLALPER